VEPLIQWCFKTPAGQVCVFVSVFTVIAALAWALSPSGQRALGLR
jgi:hypothetical protein